MCHIITRDEKWINWNNLKCKHSWVNPGQPMLTQHNAVHLWDEKRLGYHELMKRSQTVTGKSSQIKWSVWIEHWNINWENMTWENIKSFCSTQCSAALLQTGQGNVGSVALRCDVLLHAAYSLKLAPSGYRLCLGGWISSKYEGFFQLRMKNEKTTKLVLSDGNYLDY